MQKKNFINILIAITLLSCSTPITQNKSLEDKFADIIRNNIKDNALKNKSDFKIYSLNILKINTIASNTLDSQLMIKISGKINICNAMANLYLSMSATNARIKALNKKIKRGVLPSIASEDIENDTYKAQLYKDSAKYYNNLLDSLNKLSIHNIRFSDTLYQIRSFLKATEKKNNDSTNYFGIKYYYITKDKKVLDFTDTEAGKLEGFSNQQY